MMNDLISRQAAIKAAEKESQVDGAYGYMDTKSIIDMLEGLPSAQKWVPCSERLPKPEGHKRYIVTVAHFCEEYKAREVLVTEYEARDNERAPYFDGYDRMSEGVRVTAWMPLPEPYKGEEHETD